MTMVSRADIRLGARLELAHRSFFDYCHLMAPKFYVRRRDYLVQLCNDLQSFIESDDDVLVINEPPRHGKSRTAGLFVQWLLGNDPTTQIMTGSYNESLSTTFSKGVRNSIQEIKADPNIPVFSDVFPGVTIKQGDGAMNLWSLNGGYNNYLATSPTGTATGFGAKVEIIDDLIKNAKEAFNEVLLDEQWRWLTDTMLSRLESGGKLIIVMTRWSSRDLAGRALSEFPGMGYKVRHISMKAVQDDGSMLCDEILTKAQYDRTTKAQSPEIAAANYQQEPIDQKGRLYSHLKEYDDIPKDDEGNSLFTGIFSYTDTADEGSDWLASYIYGVYQSEAYILDVVFSQEPMELTEPAVAKAFFTQKVGVATIESNNGGRGFARQVESRLRDEYHSNVTKVQWFHNSQNKIARILSNSVWVMDHIYFPRNWRYRWPELYDFLIRYQREGKNEHDDAPDALTGVAEQVQNKLQIKNGSSRKKQANKLRSLGLI
ncbi:terminase [Lactobacillus brevis] [Lactiplantibacillus mudanjiangensis]|nr:terminase [Lactobacillus brevis] [Lactiplantibacillus mudanjiangensis]